MLIDLTFPKNSYLRGLEPNSTKLAVMSSSEKLSKDTHFKWLLALALVSPTPVEEGLVEYLPLEYAVIAENGISYLCFRSYPFVQWQETPFNPFAGLKDDVQEIYLRCFLAKELVKAQNNSNYTMPIKLVLVDSTNEKVVGSRDIELPNRVAIEWLRLCLEQKTMTVDQFLTAKNTNESAYELGQLAEKATHYARS